MPKKRCSNKLFLLSKVEVMNMKSFISLEEALTIMDQKVTPLQSETVPLIESVGRVCCESIYSTINNPPFDKSAMDGYAVRVEDLNEVPKQLDVIATVFAGTNCEEEVVSGTAIKIMTGAKIPKGANAVVKMEDTTCESQTVTILKIVSPQQFICPMGEDIQVGTLLVEAKKTLNYADVGILASAGIHEVQVYKKPKVAFISTGDEVMDVNQPLKEAKIYNSNRYALIARLKEMGYDVTYIHHEVDSEIEIANRLREAAKISDLILTTGGASVGDKDLIKEAIEQLGGEKLFWKILIKPGSAMLASFYEGKPIISLSGNPTAALTTFELVVKPTLQKLSGQANVTLKREQAVLQSDVAKVSPQRRFVRGFFEMSSEGQKVFITQVKSGNSILSSALNSNCLIEFEANQSPLKAGTLVTIIKL